MAVNVGDPKKKPNAGKMGNTGGKYSAKSGDLSKSQLKRAGGLKASKKPTIDYTQTSRKIGSGVTRDSSGKLLTGSVKLSNGQIGVYKAGKRVINVKRSKDGNLPPPPPKPKTPPLDMRKNAPGTRSDVKASASRIAAYNAAKLKTMDVDAKRAAAKKRPAAGRSTFSTPSTTSTSNADRPSAKGLLVKIAQLDAQIKRTTQANVRLDLEKKRNSLVQAARGIGDFFR